ncbi:unnamed protein product [Schistocephalus solidus]|uniref:Ras-associating domain-containing protein n=1 Tax=Schistocephalus solidus TaxID=70667 RepID=A0A183SSK1_SCHSO|nr:unnamed protein product [Schistocephalus solidus]
MELKVWFDGMPRVVGNVVGTTTAEEVVRALTESLKLADAYSLLAYWNGNEIHLSPSEKPLSFINRLGDHPKQFEFVLRPIEMYPKTPSDLKARPRTLDYPATPDSIIRKPTTRSVTSTPTQFIPPSRHAARQPPPVISEQEVARLEAISALTGGKKSVEKADDGRPSSDRDIRDDFKDAPIGPAFELAQLAAVDWNSQMEEQNTRHRNLLADLAEYQSRLQNLDQTLSNTRSNLTCLESELAQELTRLLESLDSAITQRRDFLASATATGGVTNTSTSLTTTITTSTPACTSPPLNLRDGLMI